MMGGNHERPALPLHRKIPARYVLSYSVVQVQSAVRASAVGSLCP